MKQKDKTKYCKNCHQKFKPDKYTYQHYCTNKCKQTYYTKLIMNK